jgi:hypothetical protein
MADLKVVKKGRKSKRTLKADTVINVVIDMSGSMCGITDDTIGGFNSFIEEQRKVEGDVLVSLVLFDSEGGWGTHSKTRLVRPYTALPLEQVPLLTRDVYCPSGGTPLRDAIGSNILDTDDILTRVKTKNPDVFNVIITDGGENTSNKFSAVDIKEMIQGRENVGWSFIYMGANQDSWAETQQYGFQQGNVMNYAAADIQGGAFDKIAVATSYHRGVSRSLKAEGLSESYTTTAFFNDAGVTEEEPAVSTTEGEES